MFEIPRVGMSARAGYSGRPLVRKLGIKSGFTIAVVDAPDGYWKLLGPLPEGVAVRSIEDADVEFDFIHVFAEDRATLASRLKGLRRRIVPAGMLWLSWPKKASGVATDLDGNGVREIGLAAGLVDTKVCAVDETWSGLKFVIRLKDRPA